MKIGKRITKTALAVAIAIAIYLGLMLLDSVLGLDRNIDMFAPTNWYTPFFAGIAVCYAVQNNPEGSIRQAKIRSYGSLIGGIFGALIIFIFESIYVKVSGISLEILQNNITFKTLEFIITSLGVIFLIPIAVKLKWSSAGFISCLTYLSVTISIRNGGMNVLFFAFNRIISTIIGVLIALLVNTIPHFKKKNKEIMFCISLDDSLLKGNKELSNYCKYQINNLNCTGANLNFMTTSALTKYNSLFKDINLTNNLILMNGTTLYKSGSYKALDVLDEEDRTKLEKIFNKYNLDFFSYLINNGVLSCYYNHLTYVGSRTYFEDRKNNNFYQLIEAIVPSQLSISQYELINTKDVLDEVIKDIKKQDISVDFVYHSYKEHQLLKIVQKDASKVNALNNLSEYKYLVVVGANETDIDMMKKADLSICFNNASSDVKETADLVIEQNVDALFKIIYKIYRNNNYKKYIDNKLKK